MGFKALWEPLEASLLEALVSELVPHGAAPLVSQKASQIWSTGVISLVLNWSARAGLFRPLAVRSSGDAYCSWPVWSETGSYC